MMPYTYILINFFTVIICFLASFDRRIQFNKLFVEFLISSTIVAIPFIIWDIWFTHKGVWWFDHSYTLGYKIAGLPLEEWLFFYCIPFACVFTYYCFEKFFTLQWTNAFNNLIVFTSLIVLSVVGLLYYERIYTLLTVIVTILTLGYLHWIAKKEWIAKASLIYLILMPGFFAVNGILTGSVIPSPVVNYNPHDFLGIRMGTIPIEDAVYGYSQFLLNIYVFKKIIKNDT
ncbi:lycopene cyclase domain-containing protein [Chryseobacterium indologenes]|uniref:lycopene cyclase domain-containing protein n=2 Tax=Chryseobacterium indologenes TaxID=253 RepID=UPI000F4E5BAB|nr:lycopene cyclase domain-containing protein [Chryseobacterium indologenes]AYZ35082.1 lycopene cyclase domain-containing protein [Chryseobacterium indologenes]MBF6643831.1 lycopene cyclase domain-containing protein [Chryseobacterium indologenes]MBU3049767.1 lycopene cyclase domain-containing protein [Chryseobacterium indologenes]MEB4762829.1 lycopene cyclase domain-containing protein [Chryseobacterium indologenes]QQQ72439.1 lycopene cyclase domain-containing protein [Chryseobacterium indologe